MSDNNKNYNNEVLAMDGAPVTPLRVRVMDGAPEDYLTLKNSKSADIVNKPSNSNKKTKK